MHALISSYSTEDTNERAEDGRAFYLDELGSDESLDEESTARDF